RSRLFDGSALGAVLCDAGAGRIDRALPGGARRGRCRYHRLQLSAQGRRRDRHDGARCLRRQQAGHRPQGIERQPAARGRASQPLWRPLPAHQRLRRPDPGLLSLGRHLLDLWSGQLHGQGLRRSREHDRGRRLAEGTGQGTGALSRDVEPRKRQVRAEGEIRLRARRHAGRRRAPAAAAAERRGEEGVQEGHGAGPGLSMRWEKSIELLQVHCQGENGKLVVGGAPEIPGASMLDKMNHINQVDDSFRRFLTAEPRASVNMTMNLLLPSTRPDADAGFIVLQYDRAHAMSGSNCMCVVTALLETGRVPMRDPETVVRLDTPAGLITARARCSNGRCHAVTLDNVPAFVEALDREIETPKWGRIKVDIAFGGIYYAIVDVAQVGMRM